VPRTVLLAARAQARPVTRRYRIVTTACFALAAAGLFTLYLQVSRTYPENSDEANILLMAWDMLHGHVMLHGWWLSDVSFYTTELPQYVLLESFLGLHPDTAHVGAAMTYALVVLLAALLARGKASRVGTGEGVTRMLLTAGILVAPQLGVGVFIVLLSVGHIGTSVPLMLTWLVIDRGGGDWTGRRWWEPTAVAILLAWALLADPLVLVTGILPLAAVCLLRAGQAGVALSRYVGRTGWRRALLRVRGYELALALACLGGFVLRQVAYGLIHYFGGFRLHNVAYQLVSPAQWPEHTWVTIQGWLAMFGAYPTGHSTQIAFAIVHMTGVAIVAWALWLVARRFLRGADLIDQVLLVAIVANIGLYVPSVMASTTYLNTREFVVALPFAAVLAGRTLGPAVLHSLPRYARPRGTKRHWWTHRRSWVVPALTAVLATYLASLGFASVQPKAPPANQQLANWLAAHNLTYGISGYWQSSIVTVETGGKVTIRAVDPGTLQRDWWESKHSWYDPSVQAATFLVTQDQPGFYNYWEPDPTALAAFGPPKSIYQVGPYTIYVWDQNLLG
jgi:hypothetical protein